MVPGGGANGVLFRSTAPSITFDLTIDGRRFTNQIFIGRKAAHPEEIPFALESP
jgi:hypothetical protein